MLETKSLSRSEPPLHHQAAGGLGNPLAACGAGSSFLRRQKAGLRPFSFQAGRLQLTELVLGSAHISRKVDQRVWLRTGIEAQAHQDPLSPLLW